jgi:hypothetical protein
LSADIDFENQLIGTTLKSGTFVNTSIGQTQLPNERFMSSKWFYVDGTSQAGLNQSSPLQIGEQEISILQGGISQIGFLQSGITKVGSITVTSTQVSTPQVGFGEINLQQQTPVYASSKQVGITQVRTFDPNSAQISTPQVNSSEVSILDHSTSTSDFYSSKITFSSSIQLEQFLSVHNVSPAYLHAINNTLSTFWDISLQPSTSLNLNIEIVNLPTGQLAEANITGFDPTGRPNSGTLYLDTDANGLSWF